MQKIYYLCKEEKYAEYIKDWVDSTIDENGNIVDGDSIIYILGKRLKSKGTLNDDTVVMTVMSNSGFISSLEEIGIKCVQTAVGDRFVYECMQSKD